MNKICTTIDQCKKLLDLGIDINTADMHYSTWTIVNNGEFVLSPNQGETIKELQEDYGNQIIPAWSLSALLSLIPKHIKQNDGRTYKFYIFNDDGIVIQRWGCSYCAKDFHNRAEYLSDSHLKYPTNVYSDKYEEPVDAAFEIVCWLLKNENI